MIKIKQMIEESLTRQLLLELIELVYEKLQNDLNCSLYLFNIDLPNNIYKKLVFDKNTNVNTTTNIIEHTALMYNSKFNQILKVKILLSHPKINVNIVSIDDVTALIYACRLKNTLVIKLLLQRPEIKVSVLDASGFTPLYYALKYKLTLIQELIKNHPTYKQR